MAMSERPFLHLIQGGLKDEHRGIYRLRERPLAAPVAEAWPKDGEWRRLIHTLIGTPAKDD